MATGPNSQDAYEAAERIRLQAEIARTRAALRAAEQQAAATAQTTAAVGRGIGSANTGSKRWDFGFGMLGKLVENSATAVGHVTSGVEEEKLKLSQAQGTLDFYNRK